MRARGGTGASSAGQGRKLRSWLAIGLLLLQVAVTAGHFHPEDFAFLQRDAGAPLAASADGQGGTPLPGGTAPTLPAHDDCPLCFNLHVAGSSALPASIVLAAPSEHGKLPPPPVRELRLASAPYLLFQTRAPPVL